MKNMRSTKSGLLVVTDRYKEGDATTLFAKMPLFNKKSPDISGSEALVLSWVIMSKYSSYNREGVDMSYADIGSAIGIPTKTVARTVKKLVDRKLLDKDEKIVFSGHAPTMEYRALTKALITTRLFDFKLKGFIASMLLVGNDYIMDMGNVSDIAKRLGINRRTATKYIKELEDLGYIEDNVLDLRVMLVKTVDAAIDRAIVVETVLNKVLSKVSKLGIDLSEETRLLE